MIDKEVHLRPVIFQSIAWTGADLERARSSLDFRLNVKTAEMRENRRLPQMTQRDAFARGLRFVYTRAVELHRAG